MGLDLANFEAVTRAFAAQPPSLVIHCAGLTRIAACQANPSLAEALNVAATRHLCGLAKDVPLIFLSTDLVFDGSKGNYVESDPVRPLSVYAETKVRAEQCVLGNRRHSVVRLSLNAGVSPGGDRSFTEAMRRAWERGETLQLFTDEFRSPIVPGSSAGLLSRSSTMILAARAVASIGRASSDCWQRSAKAASVPYLRSKRRASARRQGAYLCISPPWARRR